MRFLTFLTVTTPFNAALTCYSIRIWEILLIAVLAASAELTNGRRLLIPLIPLSWSPERVRCIGAVASIFGFSQERKHTREAYVRGDLLVF